MKQQTLHRRQPGRALNRGRGIALIEALIAILIFAFGVLGIVGLQVAMTRAQTAGKFRADAANLANEAIGLLWVDMANMNQYATANCDAYQPCLDWKNKVAATLPAGAVAVAPAASGGAVSIRLTWTVPNEGSHSYATNTNVQ